MDINSELKDAQLEITDADKTHSTNTKGVIWYNRVADKIKMMFGSENKIIATEDWVTTQVDDGISGSEGGLKSNGLIIDEIVEPVTPGTEEVHLYAANNRVSIKDEAGAVSVLAKLSETFINGITHSFFSKTVFIPHSQGTFSGLYTASVKVGVFMTDVKFTEYGTPDWYRNELNGHYIYTSDYLNNRGQYFTMNAGQTLSVQLDRQGTQDANITMTANLYIFKIN